MHTKRLFVPAFRAVDSTTAELGEDDTKEEEEEDNNGEASGESGSLENRFGWSRATKSENISVFTFREPRSIEHGVLDLGCRTHVTVDAIDETCVLVRERERPVLSCPSHL